jgi:hypothetical protein
MSKKPVPAFLQKGGGNKIAQGTEPGGAKSKKLPPVKPTGFKKPGMRGK